jgi:hypothetical protein
MSRAGLRYGPALRAAETVSAQSADSQAAIGARSHALPLRRFRRERRS